MVTSDSAFNSADVYVAQYDSGVGNQMTLDELAKGLAERLTADRVLSDHDQIVFVVHSMGGLVTQRLLTLNRQLGAKVPALFLYGTPQDGAHIANILSIFSDDPALAEMGDLNSYLTMVQNDWRSASQDWQRQGVVVRRYCAYEKLPVKGVVIVDERSSTAFCDDTVAINANHFDIVKPASFDDASYIFLRNRWLTLPLPSVSH
jgi:hypothetical protein